MSDKDTTSYSYMDDNEHFADLFNYFLYNGKQVIKPDDLVTANSVEKAIINKLGSIMTTKKARDLIKGVNIKHGNNVTYALLGIENQSLIHYAMPVRNMLYDALNYASQVTSTSKKLKEEKRDLNNAEFLSGFTKDSKLIPVITLVINWSNTKWDGPMRLSDMLVDVDPAIQEYVDDYKIKLIDPHSIRDFNKFHTMLGDVLEFIKEQNDEQFLEKAIEKKGKNWVLDIDSINVINTFTGFDISVEGEQEGNMEMCRAAAAIVEKGMAKGECIKLISLVCRKMSKGKSVEEIADDLDENIDSIRDIYDIALEFKPEYDTEKIYAKLNDETK